MSRNEGGAKARPGIPAFRPINRLRGAVFIHEWFRETLVSPFRKAPLPPPWASGISCGPLSSRGTIFGHSYSALPTASGPPLPIPVAPPPKTLRSSFALHVHRLKSPTVVPKFDEVSVVIQERQNQSQGLAKIGAASAIRCFTRVEYRGGQYLAHTLYREFTRPLTDVLAEHSVGPASRGRLARASAAEASALL